MVHLIDKDALVAEIKRHLDCCYKICARNLDFLQKSYPEHYYSIETYKEILSFIDSLQEEPVYTDFTKALAECIHQAQYNVVDPMVLAETWKDELIKLAKSKEPVSEDLEDYINEISKQFPEVSFAKLSRIAVRVAKWQKEHLWKPADGNDLPIIDREVIALLDNGKVVFAHRPPEYWDGKDIDTGKVTRNYPKTYDKGGWNIPNTKYWLDVELPKEI